MTNAFIRLSLVVEFIVAVSIILFASETIGLTALCKVILR